MDVTHYPDDLRNIQGDTKPRWPDGIVRAHFAEHIKVLNERYAHDWVDPDTGEAADRSKDVFPWSITELEEVLVVFGAPIRNELEKAQRSWAAKDAARKLEQQRKRKAEEDRMAESSAHGSDIVLGKVSLVVKLQPLLPKRTPLLVVQVQPANRNRPIPIPSKLRKPRSRFCATCCCDRRRLQRRR